MKRTFDASRRRFLSTASALSAVGTAAAPLALNLAAVGEAAAQSSCSASDYKALVCIYLGGGNDSFNTILQVDPTSYEAYRKARSFDASSPLVAAPGATYGARRLVPLAALPAGRELAVHPEMTHIEALFNAGQLAIVPNIGPLTGPIPTTADLFRQPLPPRLFSHNDQTSTWQGFAAEGATQGWGGRLGDLFASCNGARSSFTAITAASSVLWLAGGKTLQYQVTPGGAVRPAASGPLFGAPDGATTLARIASRQKTDDHMIMREQASVTKRSIELGTDISSIILPAGGAFAPPRWRTVHPASTMSAISNTLAEQLSIVARIIGGASRPGSGIKRQVFMVQMNGFDTHSGQAGAHAALLGRLSHALAFFKSALDSIGAANAVTTFTASEFGRTLSANGDGTDHGWGGHHMVMGGAVDGGKVFGALPDVGLGAPRTWNRGVMIPSIAVEQYAAHMARWFGVSATDIATVLPNLSRFDAAAAPSFFKA